MTQPASALIPPDFAALAAEACDMWQEHLATCANDPKAREELMRLLEPSRRMFADWTTLVQNASHGHGVPPTSSEPQQSGPAAPGGDHHASSTPTANERHTDETGAETARMAPDDIIVRLAQLAHRMAERMAELEQRVAKLESGHADATGTPPYDSEPY